MYDDGNYHSQLVYEATVVDAPPLLQAAFGFQVMHLLMQHSPELAPISLLEFPPDIDLDPRYRSL
ncbi:hypothetical protein D3C80_1666160 [compost metagenome]